MTLAPHLHAGVDGDLYDTRVEQWYARPPVRAVYNRTFRDIQTVAQLKATLRAGTWAWPGAYPLHLVMADGEPATFDAVRANWRRVLSDMRDGYGEWRVVACEVYWEGPPMTCCISGATIESAYGDPDQEGSGT